MTTKTHINEYLEIKTRIEELKNKLENISWYGEMTGKRTKLFCELMDSYLIILKRESWKNEMRK